MADRTVSVRFDGRVFEAKREGFQGRVFGESEDQARSRAGSWDWKHAKVVAAHVRSQIRKQYKRDNR